MRERLTMNGPAGGVTSSGPGGIPCLGEKLASASLLCLLEEQSEILASFPLFLSFFFYFVPRDKRGPQLGIALSYSRALQLFF